MNHENKSEIKHGFTTPYFAPRNMSIRPKETHAPETIIKIIPFFTILRSREKITKMKIARMPPTNPPNIVPNPKSVKFKSSPSKFQDKGNKSHRF
jgi:hypothetical protein